jgi:hypothetical protein
LLGLAGLLGSGVAPALAADAAGWRKTLEKSDPDELFQAIESVKTGKDPQAALPLLEKALATEFPHIAIACGEALRAIGPGPAKEPDVTKLIASAQKAKDEAKQRNFARVLAGWGAPEVDAPLAALASGRRDPTVQADALFLCGLLPGKDPNGFPAVREVIVTAVDKGRTSEIKMAACSAAGRLKVTAATAELGGLVRRANEPFLGLCAVLALQRIGWTEGIGSFLHVLGSPGAPDDARRACLKAVVELSRTDDVPDLLGLTRHAQKDYRDAAVLALARLAWEGRSLQPGVAAPAGEKPGGVAPVTPADKPGDQPVVTPRPPLENKGLPVLPEVIDRLIQMLQDGEDFEVRDAARTALLRIGEPATEKVRAAAGKLVEFSDDDTAQTAIELCGHFDAEDVKGALVKVAVHERDRTRRMFAARALEGIDPESAVKELLQEVRPRPKAKEPELFAVRALGYLRHKAAFDALLGICENAEYSPEIVREAQFSLERLTGHRFGVGENRDRVPIWRKWFANSPSPLHTRQKALTRAANRRNASAKGLYGLTRETERCVEDGLRFLEKTQHPGGWWDGNEKGFGGVVGCQPAYTGLALLAFLGAGYLPDSGKYREVVRRATEFLTATQYYDGSFPVTGGGDDSWIFAYLISMAVWGICESYALSIDPLVAPRGDLILRRAAQAGVDYLARVQTPGGGWRYSVRMRQSDSSATSWVLMTMKTADLAGLDVAQKAMDGIDSWIERCSFDITGETENPADLANDYEYEVGSRRRFQAFGGYFELSGNEGSALQQTSMTAALMVCRFFMGWKRSHPFQIGCANFLLAEHLPAWMEGLRENMAIAWFHYYWYYGTLAMYQMGGKYWRAWNERIRRMYPEHQRKSPPDLYGSWDPDTALLNGGRLFSTSMSILALESYYRFSPSLGDEQPPAEEEKQKPRGPAPVGGDKPAGGAKPGDKPSGNGKDGK